MNTISKLQKEVHLTAISKGWWEGEERKFPELLMLVVSELSEALEEYRNNKPYVYFNMVPLSGATKPEGSLIEMADAVIRIMDICGKNNLDLEGAILLKMEYNKTRPHRHGGKVC